MEPITITIVLNSDGSVSLSAPLDNKVLCYGLLGQALEIVQKHEARRIQVAAALSVAK